MTDGRSCSTRATLSTLMAGASTSRVTWSSNGEMSGGNPLSLSMAEIFAGNCPMKLGVKLSTNPRMWDCRTPWATADVPPVASGMATSHATMRVARAWNTAPMVESIRWALLSRMLSRTPAPSRPPTRLPMPTSSTTVPSPRRKRRAVLSVSPMILGANPAPQMSPKTTPMVLSTEANAPCRQPPHRASRSAMTSRPSVKTPGLWVTMFLVCRGSYSGELPQPFIIARLCQGCLEIVHRVSVPFFLPAGLV